MFLFENKDLPTAEELRSLIKLSTSDYDKEKIRESLANHSGGVVVLKICMVALLPMRILAAKFLYVVLCLLLNHSDWMIRRRDNFMVANATTPPVIKQFALVIKHFTSCNLL
ncbi:hypothetical protein Tco_0331911 [Tanacetum coccineum]